LSTEWEAPAIILAARPHGEAGLIVQLLTEAFGRHAGLAKGGASRSQAALWQPGNLAEVRWVARLADQLGSLSGELIHPAAALAMADPLALALLQSACAVAAGALPERLPQPISFSGLLSLVARLQAGAAPLLGDYVRWEAALLAELGYGMDFSACAVSGAANDLTWVSPRSGRAVSDAAAGVWRDKLLALPAFLLDPEAPAEPAAVLEGLKLTGHFLARDAFGHQHLPLPAARRMFMERVANMAGADSAEPDENHA
jgi:DNA repair protein RecO (recombination protein O)